MEQINKKVPREMIDTVIEGKKKGLTNREIAASLDCSASFVSYIKLKHTDLPKQVSGFASMPEEKRQWARKLGGSRTRADGVIKGFTSETARAAILKRWKRIKE